MARGEQRRPRRAPAAPDGTDRVEDVARGEVAGTGRLHVAGRTAAERLALLEDRRARRAVDRAVDAAAAEQALVRGVHDRVHLLARDVALDDLEPHGRDRTAGPACDHAGRGGERLSEGLWRWSVERALERVRRDGRGDPARRSRPASDRLAGRAAVLRGARPRRRPLRTARLRGRDVSWARERRRPDPRSLPRDARRRA